MSSPASCNWKHFLWRCLDGFICIFVLAPFVVVYWRGSFQLLDVITYPAANRTDAADLSNRQVLKVSALISAAIGITGTVVINLAQNALHTGIHQNPSKALELLLKRCYTYVYGWFIVNHWRGIWRLWDAYSGHNIQSNIISLCFGLFCLIVLRSLRNIGAPPLVVLSDFHTGHFAVTTRFRTSPKDTLRYLFDSFFSVAVVGSLVVCVWRGQWGVLDYIFERPLLHDSLLLSCLLGFSIIVSLFFLQIPAGYISAKFDQYRCLPLKIVFEDLFFYAACFGVVNIWRSIWGFCDLYIMPDRADYLISNLLCHLIGAFGTMLLMHGNSVLVRDVQIDGEFKDGKGCHFASRSLALFNQKEQRRKQQPRIFREGNLGALYNGETDKMVPTLTAVHFPKSRS